jgi:hypothetical protein
MLVLITAGYCKRGKRAGATGCRPVPASCEDAASRLIDLHNSWLALDDNNPYKDRVEQEIKNAADALDRRMKNSTHEAASRLPTWHTSGAPSAPLKGGITRGGGGAGMNEWQAGMLLHAVRVLTSVMAQSVSAIMMILSELTGSE